MKVTIPPLPERYRTVAIPELQKRFGYANVHATPKLIKVILNVGVGSAARDQKDLDLAVKTLERITGQKPVLTRAKKSIASFKIRKGMPIGAMVTLRGKRMEHFLEKLVHAALPRVRDFQGLSPDSFGNSGSYTLGVKEHLVFPEISMDDMEKIHGVGITIVTTALTSAEGVALLTALGFPFRRTPPA